jgi:hypothetical protein
MAKQHANFPSQRGWLGTAQRALHSIRYDIGYAWRSFTANPGFVAAALLSLAIGIGANTALLSVTNALLLNLLPHRDPERLTILGNRSPGLHMACIVQQSRASCAPA